MACCKPMAILIQAGVLIAAGAVAGVLDRNQRPVLVNTPEIKPLAPAAPKATAPKPADEAPKTPAGTTPDQPPAPNPAESAPKPEAPKAAAAPAPEGEQIDPELVKQGHITVAQAFDLFNSQQAIFVDARAKDVFESGHVQLAFRLPLDAFKGQDPVHFRVMDRGMTYVVYCEGGNCDESVAVQKQLLLSGYQKVYVMHDGYPGWVKAGHPTETGPDPIEVSEGRP